MTFAEKAEALKHQLINRAVRPSCTAKIIEDTTAFQALRAEKCDDMCFPLTLAAGESVVVDFGKLPCEVYYPAEAVI